MSTHNQLVVFPAVQMHKPVLEALNQHNKLMVDVARSVQLVSVHKNQITQIAQGLTIHTAVFADLQDTLKRLRESLVFKIELPNYNIPSTRTVIGTETTTNEATTTPVELGTFEETSFKDAFEMKPNGRILYRGRLLRDLKQTSKQGKLLVLLLGAKDHIVDYSDIKEYLRPGDMYKGLHDLKYGLVKTLRKEGIKVEVIAKWGEAYCLTDVE